jgi:hypothetical protein
MPKLTSGQRLEEAVATLINTQASFQANSLAIQARIEELERQNNEKFAQIIAILTRHEAMLQALPEAIRKNRLSTAEERRRLIRPRASSRSASV